MITDKETILIVDDSYEIIALLSFMLSSHYRIIEAHDGKQGLFMAQKEQPDLILLDMNMPRMGGMEVLAALRETNCQAPVIFMTAEGSEYVAVQAFRLGVHDYLAKPFSSEAIQRSIDRALRETRLAREKAELARTLDAAETVRRTVTTLAHHINNQLTVVNGGLTLLQEHLEQTAVSPTQQGVFQIVRECQTSAKRINMVLGVLQKVTKVELATYHNQTHMLDIDTALKKKLT